MSKNTLIVTGALGWLGSRLVESLLRGLPESETLKQPDANARIRCLVLPGQNADAYGNSRTASRSFPATSETRRIAKGSARTLGAPPCSTPPA